MAVIGVCRLAGVPVVLHLHASSYPEFYARLPGPARRVVRRAFRAPAAVVVLAESWREYVCRVLRVPPDRVRVLPNAVAGPDRHGIRRRAAGEPFEVLFLGRLGERKGVAELLVALADPRLREVPWRATLAGDGATERYRHQAAELGIDGRVSFPGWVDPATTGRLLARAHLLVLPSHAEGQPLSVLEAFAWGVPVISTPVGGVPEVVHDGVDGLLVPPGRPDLLAGALTDLLGDEPRRARMAAAARRTWTRSHAIGPYAGRLAAQWQQAAG